MSKALVPVKSSRVFAVDPSGETAVTEKSAQKTSKRLLHHAAYRLGILAVSKFMEEHGFQSNIGFSTQTISFEKSGFLVDVSLKDMRDTRIAYVTSDPNFDPRARREVIGKDATGAEMYGVKAKVVMAHHMIQTRYAIMINMSTREGTRNPVFIELEDTLESPAKYVFQNTLGVIANMCNSVQRLRDIFTKEKVRAAQESQIDEVAIDV